MYIQKKLQCLFENKTLLLRCLCTSDISRDYIISLNNEKKYLETKSGDVSIAQQKKYINDTLLAENRIIFGIFYEDELIGTSGIQVVSTSEVTVGIFLFDHFRGNSLGKVLVWMACHLIIQQFPVQTLRAGMKLDNQASLKCFLACGFSIIKTSDVCYTLALNSHFLKKPTGITMMNSI